MEADPMELNDEGLPVFRPDPADALERIDVAAALRLEQEAQLSEDPGRAGLRKGGKAVRSLSDRDGRARHDRSLWTQKSPPSPPRDR